VISPGSARRVVRDNFRSLVHKFFTISFLNQLGRFANRSEQKAMAVPLKKTHEN
jgi:hypothetical protein